MISVGRRWYVAQAVCTGLFASILWFGSGPAAAAPVFEGVGILPGAVASTVNAISADGSTVVGGRDDNWNTGDSGAFRWTLSEGIQSLGSTSPNSAAFDVSADGGVIVGAEEVMVQGRDAFRWTQSGGVELMTGVSFLLELPSGMTQDGSTIVGTGYEMAGGFAFNATPFSWTVAGGMENLYNAPVSLNGWDVDPRISPDGSTLIGSTDTSFDCYCKSEAWSWSAGSGRVALPELPARFEDSSDPSYWWEAGSRALEISGDGTVFVGRSEDQAVLWSSGSVLNLDDRLRGPGDDDLDFRSEAKGVSADGSTVVGSMSSDAGANPSAFIWDAINGMRDLKSVLEAQGVDLTGWNLTDAVDLSDDGLRIVGNGINPLGAEEGWVVTVPEPGTGSLLLFGLFGLAGTRRAGRGV